MNITQFFRFESQIGWSELILLATLILMILLGIRKIIESKPLIEVITAYEGYDTRGRKEDLGSFVYNWMLSITNTRGRTVSLRGIFLKDSRMPMVMPLRKNKFIDQEIPYKIYIFDKPQLEKIKANPIYLDNQKSLAWEELGVLNKAIKIGEPVSISIIIKIDNSEIPVDSYYFNFMLVFDNGFKYSLSKFVKIDNMPKNK